MSKSFFIFCFLYLLAHGSYAQPFAGQKFISGSFSFTMQNQKNDNLFAGETNDIAIRIEPSVGFVWTERTSIISGFVFEYAELDQRFNGNSVNVITNNGFGFTLASRHLFPLGAAMGIYLQPNVLYAWQHGETFDPNNFGSFNSFPFERKEVAIGVQPGLYYFLSERVAVEAVLGNLQYIHTKQNIQPELPDPPIRKIDTFGFNGGTQFALEISYYWGR